MSAEEVSKYIQPREHWDLAVSLLKLHLIQASCIKNNNNRFFLSHLPKLNEAGLTIKVGIFMKRRLKILDGSFHLSIINMKIYKSEPRNHL